MAKPTIDDVASLAGVSIKTVSRVVNREPNVRDSTKEKVERAIAELKYQPNQSARNLASRRARLIVLVYDDPSCYEVPSSGYIINLQEGALRECQRSGFELLIHPCNYRSAGITKELHALLDQVRPAGIVLAAPLSNMRNIVQAINASDTPCVRISHGLSNGKEYSVGTNDREVSAEMTRYLASLGHKRIAFISGHHRHKAVGKRVDGYKDGLEQAGLEYREDYVVAGDNSIGSGEQCAEQLLSLSPRPTAIFSANDDMAAGVMRVATRMGIDVPGDLSVAGCDDIPLAQQIYPALTTIRQPLRAMAETAAQALIGAARGHPPKPGVEIIPGTIRVRQSTGPAPK